MINLHTVGLLVICLFNPSNDYNQTLAEDRSYVCMTRLNFLSALGWLLNVHQKCRHIDWTLEIVCWDHKTEGDGSSSDVCCNLQPFGMDSHIAKRMLFQIYGLHLDLGIRLKRMWNILLRCSVVIEVLTSFSFVRTCSQLWDTRWKILADLES